MQDLVSGGPLYPVARLAVYERRWFSGLMG